MTETVNENGLELEVVPAYIIADYVWALLDINTNMELSHYGGKVPVIPVRQDPVFTDIDKPFLVYAWSENPTRDNYKHRSGQVSLAIYATSNRDITKISNLLVSAFERWDETAEDVNEWKSRPGKPEAFKKIRFSTFAAGAFDGPTPENTEGGRQSAVVMIRYSYIADYEFIKP